MGNEPNLRRLLQKTARWLIFIGLLWPKLCMAGGPPPVITVQPVSQTVLLLGIVTFSVTASSGTTMTYQWFKDGTAIPGATASSYTILTVMGTSAGNYYVQVSNAGGSVVSNNATLNVVAPPGIITQPQNQTTIKGQNASFSVIASGTGPLSYQWFFKNKSIGATGTNATLTLLSVGPNQAGGYVVVLTNMLGSITSVVATLTVLVPPGISTQPQSQSIVQGQSASFSVKASGTAPLGYQWNFNGTPMSGATTSALGLTNAQTAQAGGYTVLVTNSAGSVTSVVASLTVALPTISLSVAPGTGMSPTGFAFQASVPAGYTYVVLASSDFQSWIPIETNVATTGSVAFTDPAATNYSQRYYRVTAQ